jgi:hypothetical protein
MGSAKLPPTAVQRGGGDVVVGVIDHLHSSLFVQDLTRVQKACVKRFCQSRCRSTSPRCCRR